MTMCENPPPKDPAASARYPNIGMVTSKGKQAKPAKPRPRTKIEIEDERWAEATRRRDS